MKRHVLAMVLVATAAAAAVPTVSVEPIEGERTSPTIDITFGLGDDDGDELSIGAAFSLDGGFVWHAATLGGSTTGLAAGGSQTVTWDAESDVKTQFAPAHSTDVWLAMTVSDGLDEGSSVVKGIWVDYNEPPEIELLQVDEPAIADVQIPYVLSDPEGDALDISVEYTLDGGSSWLQATVSGQVSAIGPEQYSGSITWRSRLDEPTMASGFAIVRVTPSDLDGGAPAETNVFNIRNTPPPTVRITSVAVEPERDVDVTYVLASEGGNVLNLVVEYTLDGFNWRQAVVQGQTSDILPDDYTGSIRWPIVSDPPLFWDISIQAALRFTARDAGGSGLPVMTAPFTATNVPFPREALEERSSAGSINAIAFDSTGMEFVTGGDDRLVRVWDTISRSEIETLSGPNGHTAAVRAVSFSPDGELIASASDDNTVIVWDRSTGSPRHVFTDHTHGAHAVAFSPDGSLLASGGGDGSTALRAVSAGNQVDTFRDQASTISSVAFSPDGQWIASGSWDHTIVIRDVPGQGSPRYLVGHTNQVMSVAFARDYRDPGNPNAYLLVSGGADGTARVWDVHVASQLAELGGHDGWVNAVSISRDGSLLASGGSEGEIRIWDVSARNLMSTLEARGQPVDSVAFWPGNMLLASAGPDGWRIWSAPAIANNTPPLLSVTGPDTVSEGQSMQLALDISDDTPDQVSISVSGHPRGSGIDPSGRRFVFVPDFDQHGRYELRFSASDGRLGFDQQTYIIEVTNVEPFSLSPSASHSIREGDAIEADAVLVDGARGGRITVEATGLPRGATFDAAGAFRWTPAFDQSGIYDVTLTAYGSGREVQSEQLHIEVASRPVFGFTSGQVVLAKEGDAFSMDMLVDTARPSVDVEMTNNAQPGMQIDRGTRQFLYTPRFNQEGEYEVSFLARQGAVEVGSATLVVRVAPTSALTLNANIAPSGADQYSIEEGGSLSLTVDVLAAAGAGVVLSMPETTPNASFDPDQRHFSFTPDFTEDGTHAFSITARQGGSVLDQKTFTVIVGNASIGFSFSPQGPSYTLPEGETLTISTALTGVGVARLRVQVVDSSGIASFSNGSLTLRPGFTQSAGTAYVVTVKAMDGPSEVGSTTLAVTVTDSDVLSLNPAPVNGEYVVLEADTLSVTARLTPMAWNAGVRMQLSGRPPGATFTASAASRRLRFQPDYRQATGQNDALYETVVTAFDGEEEVGRETVTVRVKHVNPLAFDVAGPEPLREGDTISVAVVLPDIPGSHDPIVLTSEDRPAHASDFDADNIMTFTPDFTQAGEHRFAVRASQGGQRVGSRTQVVTIRDRLPASLEQNDRQVVNEGESVLAQARLTKVARDQRDPVTLGVRELPPNATFEASTGLVVFTPDYTQSRDDDYTVEFFAIQNQTEIWKREVAFRVRDTTLIEVDTAGPYSLAQGESYTLSATLTAAGRAAQADIHVVDLPENATFDVSTGSFTFAPDFVQKGPYTPALVAEQGGVEASRLTLPTEVSETDVMSLSQGEDARVQEYSTARATLTVHALAQGRVTVRPRNDTPNATFNEATGEVSFTPDFTQGRGAVYEMWFDAHEGPTRVDEALFAVRADDVTVLSVAPLNPVRVAEGDRTTIQVTQHARAVGRISLTTTPLPTGMTWDEAAGVFDFQPSFAEERQVSLTIHAWENDQSVGEAEVTIQVANTDVLSFSTPGPYATDEGVPLRITAAVAPTAVGRVDVAVNPASTAGFDLDTGVLTFSPDFTQNGTHTVTATITEDGNTVESHVFEVAVEDVLVLSTESSATVKEGDTKSVKLTLTAAAEEQGVTLRVGEPVIGARVADRSLLVTPDFRQAGSHTVAVIAEQRGVEVDRKIVSFTVEPSNVFAGGLFDTILLDEGEPFDPFTVVLVDTATADIEVVAEGPPFAEAFDPATLIWAFTPSRSQAGTYDNITFRAMQGGEEVDVWRPTIVVTDVNVRPTVTVLPVANRSSGDVAVTYVIEDFDDEPIDLTGEYQLLGTSGWLPATVTDDLSDIPSDRYAGALTWTSRVDVPSSGLVDAEFRLTPSDKDGDAEPSAPRQFTLINLLGDYTDDGVVDFDDFARLAEAWVTRDPTRDIGPAPGDPPGLQLAADGVLDFEDLAVFVVMWNWSYTDAALAAPQVRHDASVGERRPMQARVVEHPDGWLTQDVQLSLSPTWRPLAGRIVAQYAPSQMAAAPYFSPPADDGLVFLTRHNETRGTLDVQFGWFGDAMSGERDLGTITVQAARELRTQTTLKFDARGQGGDSRWQDTVLMTFRPPPARSRLLPNYPNPFNPETWIPFELNADATVAIDIYALDGAHVRQIAIGERSRGRYLDRSRAAHWDGKNGSGESVVSGTYYYRLTAGAYGEARKLSIVR